MKYILRLIAEYFFTTAIHSANMVSVKGLHQPKEPDELQKYIS